jgi:small subunit ribosomal protein S10
LSIRQTASLTKVEEGEPDKLYRIVELELKGHDPAVLKSFVKFATTAGNHLDIQSNTWNLRKPIHDRRTVLKSVHIYKKHRVQYETRTYFSFIQYKYLTGSTADTLLEYVERNLPEGVALKATKVELQALPEHLTSP